MSGIAEENGMDLPECFFVSTAFGFAWEGGEVYVSEQDTMMMHYRC